MAKLVLFFIKTSFFLRINIFKGDSYKLFLNDLWIFIYVEN